ncbi:MAG: hypothetical protein ACFFB8_17425 [Promethearchaeota archaeon]
MCWITHVRLTVGRVSSFTEFAKVKFKIHFTEAEVKLNLRYKVYSYLWERDGKKDWYIPSARNIARIPREDADDCIGQIGAQWIRPDGNASRDIEFEKQWDFGRNEKSAEEYSAYVYAYPELWSDFIWSSEIVIDLEPG